MHILMWILMVIVFVPVLLFLFAGIVNDHTRDDMIRKKFDKHEKEHGGLPLPHSKEMMGKW